MVVFPNSDWFKAVQQSNKFKNSNTMSAYEGSKQQERDEDYAKMNREQPKMFGANKSAIIEGGEFKPDLSKTDKQEWMEMMEQRGPLIFNHAPEQPLTHHQQAVKEFMVAIISFAIGKDWEAESIARHAEEYADAFINQINKK